MVKYHRLQEGIRLASSVADSVTRLNEPAELRKVALGYWGCVLFEFRANLVGLAACVENGSAQPNRMIPHVHFMYADTLLPELARLCPIPAVLGELTRLISEHRLIERIAGTPGQSQTIWLRRVESFLPRHARRFNAATAAFAIEGAVAFGAEWATRSGFTLPRPLPLTVSEMIAEIGKDVLLDGEGDADVVG